MASPIELSASQNTLSDIIGRVRSRWQLRVGLHGLMIVLGGALLIVLLGSWVMKMFHFSTLGVLGVRVAAYATFAGLIIRYLLLPLRRPPSDPRVALYYEENEPSLDTVVVSAVEASATDVPAFIRSPRFVSRVVEAAVARATASGKGARIETQRITMSSLAIMGTLIVGAFIVSKGPEFLRLGAHLLVAPNANPKEHIFIAVKPGNAQVSRGGDQAIRAELHGFDSDLTELVVQRGNGKWERLPMSVSKDSNAVVIRLFDLKDQTSYYVEAGGVRSPTYTLSIVDLPYVKNLSLDYHYPRYTGLPDKTVDDGDIAAPRGTSVVVHAATTMPVTGARILIEGKPAIPMTIGPDGILTGTIPVTEAGFYKIELDSPNGAHLPGSLDYTIDLLVDNAPTIAFIKPGRDTRAKPGGEVVTQVEATDDYGVSAVELKYSVNGGPEQTVLLASGAKREVVVGYTFFTEKLGLKDGDMVSYYAQAVDNDGVNGGKITATDIYFLNIRSPLAKAPGGGGGQDQDQDQDQGQDQKEEKINPGEWVKKQRAIVAGTFNVDRDGKRMSDKTRRENLATLSTAQSQLREKVTKILDMIVERGLPDQDPKFEVIADELPKAIAEMKTVEKTLNTQNLRGSLAPEQRALQHLQEAEAALRMPKSKSMPSDKPPKNQMDNQDQDQDEDDQDQDLANLFDPGKDQMSQQYETQEPPAPTPAKKDTALERLAERLNQLAQRQLQQQEQKERANQQQAGDGGEAQRQLANEAEKMAQQMEQQSREQPNNRQLRDGARKLKEAANDMRKAAASKDPQDAQKALDKLNDALKSLQDSMKNDGKGDPKEQVLDQTRDLVRQAESVGDRMRQEQDKKMAGQGQQQDQQQKDQQQMGQGQQQDQQQKDQQQRGQGQQPMTPQQMKQQQQQMAQMKQQMKQQQQQKGPKTPQPGQGQPSQDPGQDQSGQSDQEPQQEGDQGQSKPQPDKPGQQGGEGDLGGDVQNYSTMRRASLQSDLHAQRKAAEELRDQLQKQKQDTKELSSIIDEMKKLDAAKPNDLSGSVQQLQEALVDKLKLWEFGLHKKIEGNGPARPVLGGTNDVPAGFKDLVAEYYRSIARNPDQRRNNR